MDETLIFQVLMDVTIALFEFSNTQTGNDRVSANDSYSVKELDRGRK